MRITQEFIKKIGQGTCIKSLSEYKSKNNLKNFNMNLQTKFPRYYLSDKNILDSHYLSELCAGYLYELIKNELPCEISGQEYCNNLLKFLEDDKNYNFQLISFHAWSRTSYFINDEETNNECKNYWLYSLEKDLVVKLNKNSNFIECAVAGGSLQNIEDFLEYIKKFIYTKNDNEIGIINTSEMGHLDIKKVKIDPVKVDVELNYGKEFIKVNETIIDKLKNKKSGLYILNGPPSGGKTNYIKYLAQTVKERLFLYIPISLIDSITSPNLISLLLKYPNSVLILEDAEKAVISREESGNPDFVSTLLNLSDGILSDLLLLSVIVTFNTERNKCDSALLRRGRLFAEHYFGPLSIEESNLLAKHLNKNIVFDKPTMLGEIYNAEENNFHKEQEKPARIGFA